jgi:outer membrane protein OmpA-like peptidoglycan-associated protein
MRTRVALVAPLALVAGFAGTARAEDGPYIHARLGAGHALTEPQSTELGWGGDGALVLDVPLTKFLGIELGGTTLALSQGAPPQNPAFAQRQVGTVFGATAGVRLSFGNLWLDGGAGISTSGGGIQPIFQADLGYDIHVRGRWYVGPYVGYTQIADLGDTLVPGDARVLVVGFQFSFGQKSDKKPPVWLAKAPPPRPPPPPIVVKLPRDRDGDGVADIEDACPDVVGIPTPQEPSTNGCPPTNIKLAGDRIELPDRIYFDFDSPSVKDRSLPMLKQIAEYLEARGDIEQVDVDGYADHIGTEEYNLELSRLRAENVKAWLLRYGVASRCVTHAFGEQHPRVNGSTQEQLHENRRVEFYIQRSGDAAFQQEQVPHASN